MRIDIQISSAGGAAAAADVGVLTAALRELALAEQAAGRNVTASVSASGMGAPGGLPSGNVAAAQATNMGGLAASSGLTATGNAARVTGQHTATATVAMQGFTTATERAHRKVIDLRQELETLSRIRAAPDAQRGGLAMAAAGNNWDMAQQLISRAHDPAYVQSAQDRLSMLEERIANSNRTAQNRIAATARQEYFDTRRTSMDRFFVGGMMMGAGGGILGGLGAAGMQFGQRQMARIGLEATEGPNADAVMQQARQDAKEIFGASYRDIINFRNQLRQSGETSEATRSMVQGLSDVNAAMGGTNDSMARLIHNLSQVENQGHLTGRDLRDFATNLIPMQQFLARLKGVSPGQISDMVSKKEISAADVRAAIQLMEADPRFHERGKMITENTLPGQMEKLNENFQQLAETAGQVTAPALQGLINTGNRFISFLQGHPGAVTAGVYGVAAGGLALGGFGALNMAQGALGMAGRIMPDRVMESKIGSFLFGGGGLERAGRVQMTAAEMQLRAAQMQLGKGGLGGGAAGALPAGEALAAEEGAAGAASGGIMARLGLTPLTPLRAGVGAGLGALGAYNAYSDSGSAALSTFVGVGEAATAMFVPGGAVAVAMVEGIHLLFNHVEGKIENAPENRDPENKTPSDPKLKGMTPEQKMKYYLQESERHTARAEEIHRRVGEKANTPEGGPGAEELGERLDSDIAVQNAAYWRRRMRREVSHAAIARRDKEFEEFAEAHGASTSRVQNPAMVTNKRAEVLRHKDNGKAGREVLLLLPPSNLESDFLDATGG